MDNSIFDNENNEDASFSTSKEKDYAVALGYEQDKNKAPVVLAKGAGEVAQKIIKLAEENNIEIRKDADLLQILKAVDINEEIPVEAFAAVAEIISYIYSQNAKS